MDLTPIAPLRLEFARRTEWRREEDKRVVEFARKRDKDKERDRDKREDEAENVAAVVALATEAQLAEFTVKLDAYEAATVEALTENTEQLAYVDRELERMLGEAYVLPDGRRVFKIEDGLRVFDEHGQELPVDDIDPDQIADEKPTWESYSDFLKRDEILTQERADLLKYQQDLDTARERLRAGDVTAEEIKAMDEDLKRNLPEAAEESLLPSMSPDGSGEVLSVSSGETFRPRVKPSIPEFW